MSQQHRSPILELLHQFRILLTLLLGGLLGIFALQNMATVELSFLFWTFESRRIVVIALAMIVGLVVGWLFGLSTGRKRWRGQTS